MGQKKVLGSFMLIDVRRLVCHLCSFELTILLCKPHKALATRRIWPDWLFSSLNVNMSKVLASLLFAGGLVSPSQDSLSGTRSYVPGQGPPTSLSRSWGSGEVVSRAMTLAGPQPAAPLTAMWSSILRFKRSFWIMPLKDCP